MNYRFLVLLLVFSINGCTTKHWAQAGSDKFKTPIPEGKAVVMVGAKGKWLDDEGTMLIALKKYMDGLPRQNHYKSKVWDFATYPGATIPGFSPKERHLTQAYLIDPGKYVVIRCAFRVPERDYCPENYWTHNGLPLGMAFFEVKAGEVINTGILFSTRTYHKGYAYYEVDVLDNHQEAIEYMKSNYPSLVNKLEFRPLSFMLNVH